MTLTRDAIRASIERAGDEHWAALIHHHEDQYPASPPTPVDVCQWEAERLNDLGFGRSADFELVESRVQRIGNQVELTHVLLYRPLDVRVLTEPFRDYGP